jgi:hypothetical protein
MATGEPINDDVCQPGGTAASRRGFLQRTSSGLASPGGGKRERLGLGGRRDSRDAQQRQAARSPAGDLGADCSLRALSWLATVAMGAAVVARLWPQPYDQSAWLRPACRHFSAVCSDDTIAS